MIYEKLNRGSVNLLLMDDEKMLAICSMHGEMVGEHHQVIVDANNKYDRYFIKQNSRT